MGGRRLKYTLMLLIIVGSGLALLAGTQEWFTLVVGSEEGGTSSLAVSGAVAAPALSALAFAGIALAAALAIAGVVIRIILGILGVVLGGCIVLSATLAIADPVAAGTSVVTAATGVAGQDSVRALVTSVDTTAWPVLTIIAGALLALASLAVLVTARAWPASSRRYQAVRLEGAEPTPKAGAVDEWDELSRGDDPTA